MHLMAQLNSPFVVRYHDCFVEENTLHVVMEYCSEGDLSQRGMLTERVFGADGNLVREW